MQAQKQSAVLRGRKVALRVREHAPTDEVPDPPAQEVEFRFDLNAIAGLEEKYESHMALKDRMAEQPIVVLREILAEHVLKCSLEEAGARMIDEDVNLYYAAIEAALSLAYGATPEAAGKVVAARLELMEVMDARAVAALETAMRTMLDQGRVGSGSRGANGSKVGRSSGAPSKSSGG